MTNQTSLFNYLSQTLAKIWGICSNWNVPRRKYLVLIEMYTFLRLNQVLQLFK